MVEATFELLLKLTHIRVIRVEQTKAGASIVTVESTLQHSIFSIKRGNSLSLVSAV